MRPIEAVCVMDRVQADLVSLDNLSSQSSKYVLSVLDVYSRFLWLRTLIDKSSNSVSRALKTIFLEHGPPHIIQTDNGSEFKGAVKTLSEEMHIRLIHGRPHHPQSQGKCEKSHQEWKKKLRIDLEKQKDDFNLEICLQENCRIYNQTVHSAFGGKFSPFQVYYGRQSNSVTKLLLSSEASVQNLDIHDADMEIDIGTTEESIQKIESIRDAAHTRDQHESNLEVLRKANANPPSQYQLGEMVYFRKTRKDQRLQRGGASLTQQRLHQGKITEVDPSGFRYKVDNVWVQVEDITSLTRTEENRKQKKARTRSSKITTTDLKTCECQDPLCLRPPSKQCSHRMNYICCRQRPSNLTSCKVANHNQPLKGHMIDHKIPKSTNSSKICPTTASDVQPPEKKDRFLGQGLVNLGNTCFLNSVLQCLKVCTLLDLTGDHRASTCVNGSQCLACALNDFLEVGTERPERILSCLQGSWPNYQPGEQHDAHELYCWMISKVHADIGLKKPGESGYVHGEKGALFSGRLINTMTCSTCNLSIVRDPECFTALSVELTTSLEASMKSLLSTEILTGANSFSCTLCGANGDAKRTSTFESFPASLVFHVKRGVTIIISGFTHRPSHFGAKRLRFFLKKSACLRKRILNVNTYIEKVVELFVFHQLLCSMGVGPSKLDCLL